MPKPRAPHALQASDFETAIARTEHTDPGSPSLLSTKLAYAQFLLSKVSSRCGDRLDLAQEQLGSVAAAPQVHVMFPDGWALVSDLEYHQHLARANCGSKADRRDELLAAVESARRAVLLYRNELDYNSMVIMQFDAAVALRRLGESAAALTALAQALQMDRDYGFQDDARENYKLLLTWRGEPAGAAQVARRMQDFPNRRITLKFDWHPIIAEVTLRGSRASFADGRIVSSRAGAVFVQHIAAAPGGGWRVSYSDRLPRYEAGVWPTQRSLQAQELAFPAAPLPPVSFKVSATGAFEGGTDSEAFAARLNAKASGLIRSGAPKGPDSKDLVSEALNTTRIALSPGILEADTAEHYQLDTAMWVGASLEQGMWYQISAPLALPGIPEAIVQNRIEFAFTRRLPCAAGAAGDKCVEIVIRANPDEASLRDLMQDMTGGHPNNVFVDYFASREVRIVTDPATLLPYSREERTYWYAAVGKDPRDRVLESEHLVSTTRYESH